jgi:methyl-accepting chemotaxis protein
LNIKNKVSIKEAKEVTMGIRFKLSAVVSLLVIVALSVLSFTGYSFAKQDIWQANEELLKSNAAKHATEVELFLEDAVSKVEGVSRLKDLVSTNPDEVVPELARVYPFYDKTFANISFANKGGTRWNYKGEEGSIADREYFIKTMESGLPMVSDPLVSNTTGALSVIVVAPIKDQRNANVGVSYATLALTELQEVVEGVSVGSTGFGFILDQYGTVLAHGKEVDLLGQNVEAEEAIKEHPLTKLWEMKKGQQSIEGELLSLAMYGKEQAVMMVPISVVGSDPWYLGVTVEKAEIEKNIHALGVTFVILSLIAIVVTSIIVSLFSSRLIAPILKVNQMVQKIASGDLRKSNVIIKNKDELGQLYEGIMVMTDNLQDFIKQIVDTATHVASASEQLTATSQQSAIAADEVAKTIEEIAKGATDQAKDTELGAEHVNELGELVEKERDYVSHLGDSTLKVESLKEEGTSIVKELVQKTKANNQSLQVIHEVITSTNESAKKIEAASHRIEAIAQQTNLLALNAAIEAARAGEAGRGFAVVADEIRKLAENSNQFTAQIVKVIEELLQKAELAVVTMAEVDEAATTQTISVQATNEKFEGIALAMEDMKKLTTQIVFSSQVMEDKKNEVVNIIANLSAISQETAAGTEQAAASVEEQTASMAEIADSSDKLAKLAEEMKEKIATFQYE